MAPAVLIQQIWEGGLSVWILKKNKTEFMLREIVTLLKNPLYRRKPLIYLDIVEFMFGNSFDCCRRVWFVGLGSFCDNCKKKNHRWKILSYLCVQSSFRRAVCGHFLSTVNSQYSSLYSCLNVCCLQRVWTQVSLEIHVVSSWFCISRHQSSSCFIVAGNVLLADGHKGADKVTLLSFI